MTEKWNIAICDEERMSLEYIAEKVKKKFLKYYIQTECEIFENPMYLLEKIEKSSYFQMYFLNVSMTEMDGIVVGNEIKKRDPEAKIIFLSAREADIFRTFEVGPFGFIRKSNFLEDLDHAIDDFCLRYREEGEAICWIEEKNGEYTPLKVQQVLFLKEEKNNVYAVTEKKSFWIENSLKEIEKKLNPYPFVKIDRSCMVNVAMINHMEKNKLFLDNGTELSMGYYYKKNVQKQICKFLM